MAGRRWLVSPVQGLLLCILALHLCAQDPLATAEHAAAPSASVAHHGVTAAPSTSVAHHGVTAAPSTSVAQHATAANASVAHHGATAAPSASVAHYATAPNASVACNASVAANSSVNATEETPLTCQSFQCSGERCYQDEAHANETVTCHNETHCELYRFSSTNYTARCSSACGAEMCRTNGSVSRQQCALDCCDSRLCLQLNASSYGDLPPTTAPPATTTTTPRPPPRNGKVCAAFSCHGDGCFKGKKTVARCIVGHDFCEMKKTGLNYMAGCSRACKAAKPVCAGGMKAACYQECCPATLKASCLKLDGKVHVNSAGQVTLSQLLKLMSLDLGCFSHICGKS
ncbi:uncharacterized protein LOC141733034 isoform X2 [Larus michahellis]|uniref:uncharacterized protein LOC141733034 isoform X2 n=1 Tax=Larus michahellis TaxID=119627 RepID=UPI003D9B633F